VQRGCGRLIHREPPSGKQTKITAKARLGGHSYGIRAN